MHAGKTLPVTAWDRANTQQLASGTLQSVDSQIDPTTGTIKLKALFANADESLFPQQFVNVVLLLDTLHGATLDAAGGDPARRPGHLRLRRQRGPDRERAQGDPRSGRCRPTSRSPRGLKPGEIVVVDGADKLKDGAKVLVRQPRATTATSAAPAAKSSAARAHSARAAIGTRRRATRAAADDFRALFRLAATA